MRVLLFLSALASIAVSTGPVDESELDYIVLRQYLIFACSFTPELLPKTIHPSVGLDVGEYLCEWARLDEDRFLELSNKSVKLVHERVRVTRFGPELLRNINAVKSRGFDDEGAFIELSKFYYKSLRELEECQGLI